MPQAALEELQRYSQGNEEALASLEAALTARQPASLPVAGPQQEPKRHPSKVRPAINRGAIVPWQPVGAPKRKASSQSTSDASPRMSQLMLGQKAKSQREASQASPTEQHFFPAPLIGSTSDVNQYLPRSATKISHAKEHI